MAGSVRQMQMAYAPEEDRILYRVNTTRGEEFRFWVTRRFAMLLLKVLSRHRSSDPDVSRFRAPEDRQALHEFKKEQAIGEADFGAEFNGEAVTYPLGEQALLAYKLSYAINPDNNLRLTLEPKEGEGISLVINHALNFTLSELLLSAARKGEWRLDDWLADTGDGDGDDHVVN